MGMEKYAVIDLGSNTVRLVIFEVYGNGSYKMVESLSDTVRLSRGLAGSGSISPENMEKAFVTIRVFSDFCTDYCVPKDNIIAYATAAVRDASNGGELIQRLHESFGIRFRVLSGNEEALYVFNAVYMTFDLEKGIAIDLGGGSTEILRFEGKNVIGCASIPYGCVSATEAFLGSGTPPEKKNIRALEGIIEKELSGLPWLKDAAGSDIIAIGGTARAAAKIHMRGNAYPFGRLHGYRVNTDDLTAMHARISGSSPLELQNMQGLSSDRTDVICGGITILHTVCQHIGSKQIILSGSGLREGVFYDKMQNDKKIIRFDNALDFSIRNFMLLYGIREAHARRVSSLALKLFRELKGLHGLCALYERYLRTAALIHDAGIYISYYNKDRHSLYLIMNSPINGLDHREHIIVAIAASGLTDRKLSESLRGSYSAIISRDDLKAAKILALIIRISEALDKSETGSIEDVRCDISGNKVRMITERNREASIELKSTASQAGDFKKMFGKSLEVL